MQGYYNVYFNLSTLLNSGRLSVVEYFYSIVFVLVRVMSEYFFQHCLLVIC